MRPRPRVVDASVAFKWVITAEVLSSQAQALLTDSVNAGIALVGPPHLPAEVTSGLYQRVRTQDSARRLTETQAQRALVDFLAHPLQLLSPATLYERAFVFARTSALPSLYDALYVVLAQLLGTELWTADQRLLAALGNRAPWVRSLAAYT